MSKGEFTLLDVSVIDEDMMIAKVNVNKDQTKVEVRYVKAKRFMTNFEKEDIHTFFDTKDEDLKRKIYQFLDNEFTENEEYKLVVLLFFGEGYYGN